MSRHDSYGYPELDLLPGETLLTHADFSRGGFAARAFRTSAGTLFLTDRRLSWLPAKLLFSFWMLDPLHLDFMSIARSYQRRSIRWGWLRALVVETVEGASARFYPMHSPTDVVKWGRAITDLARTHQSLEHELS